MYYKHFEGQVAILNLIRQVSGLTNSTGRGRFGVIGK